VRLRVEVGQHAAQGSREGYEVVVQLLLEKGADFESKTDSGQTLLSWAAENGHEAHRATAARQGSRR
jgi:ankyrin repeat protein